TIGDRSKNFGHGLRQLIEPRGYLAICAANRPEWMITDFACMLHSIISVPIYCLFNDRDVAYIISNTKISVVVCDNEMLPKFTRLHSQCPSLRHIVCMDPISKTTVENANLSIHYMADIEKYGTMKYYESVPIGPTDCLTVIYTSGSSGFPKGVIINKDTFWSNFLRCYSLSYSEYVSFVYEPLAWLSGRESAITAFIRGGRTGFSSGDVSRLIEEMALVRPTQFGGPPTIWNKIYSEFKATLSLATANLTPDATAVEKAHLLEQFSKLIPRRCRLISIGGAMVSSAVLDFMRECFLHCFVIETYGITECGSVAVNNVLENKLNYRLESVPELGYTLDDKPFPRGEFLVKTEQIFSGYINNTDETRAALTEDGFFRTGDIVELHTRLIRKPRVRVIDRKKNFFKLSQGQFVSPEFLQDIYNKSVFVHQIYIHGDLLSDSVAAVVVPNREYAQTFMVRNNLGKLDINKPDPKFCDAVMQDLQLIAKQESLRKHEIPSRLLIDFEPFTPENGLLTSTMKPCRPKLSAHYAERLKTATHSIEQKLKTIIETATGRSLLLTDKNEDFMAMGGDSLAAVRLSRMIQDELAVSLPANVFFQSEMNLKRLTTLVQNPSKISSYPESIVPQMLHDSDIDLNITVGKCKPTHISPSMVFVTGTTGYVGGFLLAEMLNVYPLKCKFVCLVRCKPLSNPIDRVRDNMSFLRIWKDEFRERIIALRGDLAKDHFGLDNEIYESIAAQTDIIFHCGATVNFILPYNKLYGPNVCGTREIIRLATHGATCIPVQYISTVSVLSSGIIKEVLIDKIPPDGLTSGYGQSKWVAEKLMYKASRSGLPVVIYRLGSISSNTETGVCNRHDLHTLLMAAIMKIGCYPLLAMKSTFDGLPVDFCAKSIVYLSQKQPSVYGNVYHVANPYGRIPFEDIVKGMVKCGVETRGIAFDQWQNKMKAETMRTASKLKSDKRGYVALLYSGTARSFSSNFESHIINMMSGCPYTIHLFFHTYINENNQYHFSQDKNEKNFSKYTNYLSVNATLSYFHGYINLDNEYVAFHNQAVKVNAFEYLSLRNLREIYKNTYDTSMKRFLGHPPIPGIYYMWHSQRRCEELRQQYVNRSADGIVYKWIFRMRHDAVYYTNWWQQAFHISIYTHSNLKHKNLNHDIKNHWGIYPTRLYDMIYEPRLKSNENIIYIPFGWSNGGYNDQFAAMSSNRNAQHYFMRILNIKRMLHESIVHPETSIHLIAKWNHIKIDNRNATICYDIVRISTKNYRSCAYKKSGIEDCQLLCPKYEKMNTVLHNYFIHNKNNLFPQDNSTRILNNKKEETEILLNQHISSMNNNNNENSIEINDQSSSFYYFYRYINSKYLNNPCLPQTWTKDQGNNYEKHHFPFILRSLDQTKINQYNQYLTCGSNVNV
ncbi:unnamed protein product, partial [Adineta steineri]